MGDFNYSSGQVLALFGLVIGAVLIFVGAISPDWIVSDPQDSGTLGNLVTLVGLSSSVADAKYGLYQTCTTVLNDQSCEWHESIFKTDEELFWCQLTGATGAGFATLSILGLLPVVAKWDCCKRLRLISTTTILSAFSAAFSAGYYTTSSYWEMTTSVLNVTLFSIGWAFYVMCAGAGVMLLASILASVSTPEKSNKVYDIY